jgi:hypothetical protein
MQGIFESDALYDCTSFENWYDTYEMLGNYSIIGEVRECK